MPSRRDLGRRGGGFLVSAIGVAGLVDACSSLGVGATSGNGLMAGLSAVLLGLGFVVMVTDTERYRRGNEPRLIALVIGFPLLAWILMGLVLRGVSQEALQNSLVFLTFLLALECGQLWVDGSPSRRRMLLRTIELAGVPAAAWVLAESVGLLPEVVGYRAFALAVLPAFVVVRCASTLTTYQRAVVTVLYVTAVASSLSRTATILVLAILVLAEASKRGVRRLRAIVVLGLVVLGGSVALSSLPEVRDRFFGGDQGVTVGGVAVNTSGRDALWAQVWDVAQGRLWYGHGLGESHALVESVFISEVQPHNDYLRFIFDLGFVGLIFWAVLVIGLVAAVLRATPSFRSPSAEGLRVPPRLAPLLALLAMSIAMITDNVIIYSFVLVPFGLLIGAHTVRTDPEGPDAGSDRPQLLHAQPAQR